MSDHGFVDGNFGPLTSEAAYLFDKSEEYIKGFRLGKSSAGSDSAGFRIAADKGAEFQAGFLAGRTARRERWFYSGSYRDPDLSPRWLNEADSQACRSHNRSTLQKIIHRLTAEVRRLRGWK